MNAPITNFEAVRLYPELQHLADARENGWRFRNIQEPGGPLEGISGSFSRQEFTDAIFVFDRTNVTAARVLAEEYGGGCVWSKEGGDLEEIVFELLGLPEPDAPRAPRLVKRSSLLWTPR